MIMNKKGTILITGGTGSFGKSFARHLLKKKSFKKIIILSRDELKQHEMKNEKIFKENYKTMRYFIGDIRERDRLINAFNKVDYIIHAAALKQVDTAEYNPFEFIKTNIQGTENVIQAAVANSVKKVVALSTDKAVSPINLYGATKLCADKLLISANNMFGDQKISFSLVRYGNVVASRGSIIPILIKNKNKKEIELTDKYMTRFNITLEKAVELVMLALKNSKKGEIYVPKMKSYRLIDLAKTIAPEANFKFTGIRPGEKIHEEIISETESLNIQEKKDYFIISTLERARKKNKNKLFSYKSNTNKKFLSSSELKNIIKKLYNDNTL